MTLIYLNGEYLNDKKSLISHKDCGFTTGIGIFDSMLVIDGNPIHDKDHFDRILHDVEIVIGLNIDLSFNDFQNICTKILNENNLTQGHARIRTTVTGGKVKSPLALCSVPTILIDAAPCSPSPDTPLTCAIITNFPRIAGCILENCKRLDYSRSYAARRKAESLGSQEAILTNTDGNIASGATSNIFIEENGKLITPPLSDGVLAGVTRKNILNGFLPRKYDSCISSEETWNKENLYEDSITPERLKAANNIYLTNSFICLRKVVLQ